MSRIYNLETALRDIMKSAAGASRMTRRLEYIHEIAASTLAGRPMDDEIREPRERSLLWKNGAFYPERPGRYVIRTADGFVEIALFDGQRWICGVPVHEYLTLRIPVEKK